MRRQVGVKLLSVYTLLVSFFKTIRIYYSLKMSKWNYYSIKWPHSVYENNTAVRNTTIDVRRHLTTGHQGEKSAVYIQHVPVAFPPPNLPQERQDYQACLHSFLGIAAWAFPVWAASEGGKWPVDYSVPLYHRNTDATRTKREFIPIRGPTKNKPVLKPET